jgi:RNA polymerase sigma factor (sigma-70 family)
MPPGTLLQALTLQLQPHLTVRQQLLQEPNSPQREKKLAQVMQGIYRAGLKEFNDRLAQVCRSYFQRHGSSAGLDIEDFTIEVQILTLNRLLDYDPQKANFHTWFISRILPRVYADMQRKRNPHWSRPEPKTAEGQWARQTAFQMTRGLPLDHPMGSTVADSFNTEQTILEEQCAQWFHKTLEELSLAEQILLQRVYLQQEPQKVIAQSLGISPATLCVRLQKICRQLALSLGSDFVRQCGETQFCVPLQEKAP